MACSNRAKSTVKGSYDTLTVKHSTDGIPTDHVAGERRAGSRSVTDRTYGHGRPDIWAFTWPRAIVITSIGVGLIAVLVLATPAMNRVIDAILLLPPILGPILFLVRLRRRQHSVQDPHQP